MRKIEQAKILKKRALSFLKNARRNVKENETDLAAFNAEQAAQLLLKYFLFMKVGDYPKTHSLKTPFKEVVKVFPKLRKTFEENINLIGDMESAYIGARYLPFGYLEEEVRRMIKFVEMLKREIDEAL